MNRTFTRLWLGAACLLGCGGGTLLDGVYEDGQARYRVGALPPAWRRVGAEGNDLAFHRPGMGTISVNATCSDYEDVPATALVNHLLFDTTERRFLREETVTLDGRGARHVLAQVELDGVPVEIEVFVLKKDGCVFDLGHVRGRDSVPAARQSFLGFVSAFAVLEVHPNG
jgi:hypothetical protein